MSSSETKSYCSRCAVSTYSDLGIGSLLFRKKTYFEPKTSAMIFLSFMYDCMSGTNRCASCGLFSKLDSIMSSTRLGSRLKHPKTKHQIN